MFKLTYLLVLKYFMMSFFNWNCCSKPAQGKEYDLIFDEASPPNGIRKKPSDASNMDLKSKGSKTGIDSHAKLLRANALK